ncbi:MAG: hypothetical protein ACI9WU_002140 [Myxococcota bacterium]|jgi:hypothetical protein
MLSKQALLTSILAPILMVSLASAKRPALPKVGEYSCRVSKEYKFRPCTIHQSRGGGLMITIPDGLVQLKGHLHAVEGGMFLEGNLHGQRAFGCHPCNEECSKPGAKCGCDPIPEAGAKACLEQPLSVILRKGKRGWSGVLPQRMYEVIYEKLKPGQKPGDRAVVGYTYTIDLFSIDIRK